jgi:putative ABC transport system permease protein
VIALEAVRQALRTLRAHRMRSALTLFGVVWGTAAVILLVGWGQGVRAMMERGYEKTGRNLGIVWPGKIGEDFTPAADRRWIWLDNADLEVLRRRARLPELVAGETWQMAVGTFGQRSVSLDVRGVDPVVMAIRGVPLAAGRGISRSDLEQRRRVVILGHDALRSLLGGEGGIGSWVRLDGTPFRVVGVLERVGIQLDRDRLPIDEQAWIPITRFQVTWPRWWADSPVVDRILFRIRDRHLLAATQQEIRAILAERVGVPPGDSEAIGSWSPLQALEKIPLDQTIGVLWVIAVTTLVIGGVGVVNMMLDAVHERRQEIGVRLAIGARRRDILAQFFLETFVVVGAGGALGALLGALGCAALGSLRVPDLVPLPVLSGPLVAAALAWMLGVAVVAALAPAWRAVRVEPSQSLRME